MMGPRARELLQSMTPDDMSDGAFPFATSRVIELGYALVRASRITFVGGLGWELSVPTEFMQGVYDELAAAGVRHGMVHAGYHTLNSLRIEKAYRIGRTTSPPMNAVGGRFGLPATWNKPAGFIGREALAAKRDAGSERALVQIRTWRSRATAVSQRTDLPGDGERVGFVTSAMYGHTLGAAVSLGYVAGPRGDPERGVQGGAASNTSRPAATRSSFRMPGYGHAHRLRRCTTPRTRMDSGIDPLTCCSPCDAQPPTFVRAALAGPVVGHRIGFAGGLTTISRPPEMPWLVR